MNIKYSNSDIVREYNRSQSMNLVANKLGVSLREVKLALKKAGIIEKEIHRTKTEQEEYDTGIVGNDFIDI